MGDVHTRQNKNLFWMEPAEILTKAGLSKENAFLDLGCGTGRFTIPALQIVGPTGKVYAVDRSKEAIEALKQTLSSRENTNNKNFFLIITDVASGLPVHKETIDFVLMANVFHDLVVEEKAESTLKEVLRIIKETGVLAIIEFKKKESPFGPPLSIRLSPQEVEEFLKARGFERKGYQEIGEYHYLLTFLKRETT